MTDKWPKKDEMTDMSSHSVEELEKTIEIWEERGIYAAMDYFYGKPDPIYKSIPKSIDDE